MRFLKASAAFGAMCLLSAPAWAGFEVCNATDVRQSIAVGYKANEIWVSEGWWNAEPGACVLVLSGNLKNRYYYVKALADGHEFKAEDYSFCITQEEFTIEGDEDCEGRGYVKSYFIEVDTGETATHFTKAITKRMSVAMESAGDGGGATPEPEQNTGKTSGKAGDNTESNAGDNATAPTPEPAPEQPAQGSSVTVENGVIKTGMGPVENAEAFTKQGHFQSCEDFEGQLSCGFHVEGWKFYVYDGGPTPRAVLDALQNYQTGTPVSLTGDILYYGDITAEIAVREVTPMPGGDPFGEMMANLQGSWVSLDDPASGMTVSGLEMEVAHGEQALGVRFLRLAETCDAANGAGPVLIQTNPEDQEPQCYMVARADGDNLDLIYFARGNTLRYKRP